MNKQYIEVLYKLKEHIRLAQQSAIIAVNVEMLFLYWEIGQLISQQKKALGWGTKVVKQLSQDLSAEFSEMKGFSERNLNYMLKFAETYDISTIRNSILQTLSAKLNYTQNKTLSSYDFRQSLISKITWSHHVILMRKVKNEKERFYYMQRSIQEGWSSRVLTHKIEQKLFQSQGKIPNNFDATLPEVQSELAKQTLKDHYIFDFLSIGSDNSSVMIYN